MDTLNFELPGISPVGLDLIALLNTPSATVKQIAAQAKLDSVIFGSIIAYANSPLYRGAAKSTDILTSLVRLGQREIKRIVYQVVLRAAFYHENARINALMRQIWLQSLTSNIFMQRFVATVPEAYSFTIEELDHLGCLGLVHNIGYIVLLINFQDRFLDFFARNGDLPLPRFFEEERSWFDDYDHFSAGNAMLDVWNFPPTLGQIVGQYHAPSNEFVGTCTKLHNLLRLSRHVISLTEYNFHPIEPANFWLTGTELPAVEVDYEELIEDVRDNVRQIESTYC